MALRPLLGNMPRSPVGANTPKTIQTPADLEKYLADVGERTEWVACPQCAKEWNQLTIEGICYGCVDQRDKDAKRQLDLGQYLLKTIGVYGVERYSFGGFDVTSENEYAFRRFKEFKPETENLFVFGPCGTGKTHLAGALFKATCGANKTVRWTNPIYLSRAMRSRWAEDEESFVEWLVSHQVLIIDDLGVGKDTNQALALLYEVIDRRRHKGLNGLVITSNPSLDDLAQGYKDDRIASRIAGMCEVIQIDGKDRRSYKR